jgi:hypothetical protein
MATIDIDPDAFNQEALRLQEALNTFQYHSTASMGRFLARLQAMNSDSMESLKKVLKRIDDDEGPELLAKIEAYQRNMETLASTFVAVDSELAADIARS